MVSVLECVGMNLRKPNLRGINSILTPFARYITKASTLQELTEIYTLMYPPHYHFSKSLNTFVGLFGNPGIEWIKQL